MAKLIFGCGYLGRRVARRWHDAGEDVFAVTRSVEHARKLAALDYAPLVADILRPETLVDLPAVDTVLFAVGFDRGAGRDIQEVFVSGLCNVLAALPGDTGRLIYISSTGVYGQTHGEAVDERSPAVPTRDGGRACLAAEQALAAHPLGNRGIVLRMAGLYGPGRVPQAELIRRGDAIPAVDTGVLNLIHVDDAASVVVAADALAPLPRTYVVSDGHPIQRKEYYSELSRLLRAPAPRFEPPPADAHQAQRAVASKAVSNTRMMSELGVVLHYPTFREGLAAILASN